MNNTHKLEQWTSWFLVALAVGAFVLSFAGMYAVAVDAGYDWLSFLWPLVTETAVVIFSLVYLVAKLKAYHNRWLMPLIVACTSLSVAFNVVHAPAPDLLSRSVVALPPLLLFAAFKTWIWKVELDVTRQNAVVSIDELNDTFTKLQLEFSQFERDAEQQRDTLTAQVERERERLADILSDQREAKRATNRANVEEMNAARATKIEERREQVFILKQQGWENSDIADELDVSAATVRRDIKALNGRVRVA